MNFVKGIALGVVAGTAIGMVVTPHGKTTKSAIGRALKAAGNVVENITDTFTR